MTAFTAPVPLLPRSRPPAARHLALACAVSLLLHGGVLAAAHWLWAGASPVTVPPMVAIPVIAEASLTHPGKPDAGSQPTAPREHVAKTAPPRAAVKAVVKAAAAAPRPEEQTNHKAATDRRSAALAGRAQPARPAWTLDPPLPPRRPSRLARRAEASGMPPPKATTADPRFDAPIVVKTAPVTAARAGRRSATAPGIGAKTPGRAAALQGAGRGPTGAAAGPGNPAPVYPWISRRRGEQGRVILEVNVTAEGRAAAVGIKRSSGSARLDQAALAAVWTWRFAPARRAGRAIAARIDVPITFRLTD